MRQLEALLKQELSPLIGELKEFNLDRIIGSSGTFETMGAVIAYECGDILSAENLNGYVFQSSQFSKVFAHLLRLNRTERLMVKGMETARVEMILMGGAILSYLLKELTIKTCMVASHALKEGILHRYLRNRRERMARFLGAADRNLRAKSVKQLAEKYRYEAPHCIKVSEIAEELFQQLTPLHGYGSEELEMLRYAAVLHDIGKYINPSGYHKHGQYLIMNSRPSGFSTNELVLLANLVRYHRKSLPKQDHFHFNILVLENQQRVQILGGILRIADNLDKGHRNLIKTFEVHADPAEIHITLYADEDLAIEIMHAMNHRHLLEQALSRQVHIRQGLTRNIAAITR